VNDNSSIVFAGCQGTPKLWYFTETTCYFALLKYAETPNSTQKNTHVNHLLLWTV